MKRDSKLNFFIYRKPWLMRMGAAELAEQALEHCTEIISRLQRLHPLPCYSILTFHVTYWTRPLPQDNGKPGWYHEAKALVPRKYSWR
ncbi:MAG: hypothetical protein APF77_14480 [Clostridia bacterium BRH_c25]|nr:MAG: hypothetical protein APF77_14480 [Clostridia bacterium BRH_c25]